MQNRSPANALSDVCGLIACGIGAGVLVNWPGRYEAVRQFFVSGPSIRPATAASILVLGVLLMIVRRINTGTFTGVTRAALATAFLGSGLLALIRIRMLVDRVNESPRAVSPHTVGSLLLLGTAMLIAIRADTRRRRVAIITALIGAIVPWLGLLGYTNGASMF